MTDKPRPKKPYLSPLGRTKLNAWAGAIAWVAVILGLGGTLYEINLLQRIRYDDVTMAEAEFSDQLQAGFAGLLVLTLFFWYLTLLMTVYRLNRNTWALGVEEIRFRPGWSVGVWFIPFVNLVLPYMVLAELWRANNPTAEATGWRRGPRNGLILVWWLSLIFTLVFDQIVAERMVEAEELDEILNADYWTVVSDLLWIVTLPMAILIVRRLGERQQLKADRLGIGDGDRIDPNASQAP